MALDIFPVQERGFVHHEQAKARRSIALATYFVKSHDSFPIASIGCLNHNCAEFLRALYSWCRRAFTGFLIPELGGSSSDVVTLARRPL